MDATHLSVTSLKWEEPPPMRDTISWRTNQTLQIELQLPKVSWQKSCSLWLTARRHTGSIIICEHVVPGGGGAESHHTHAQVGNSTPVPPWSPTSLVWKITLKTNNLTEPDNCVPLMSTWTGVCVHLLHTAGPFSDLMTAGICVHHSGQQHGHTPSQRSETTEHRFKQKNKQKKNSFHWCGGFEVLGVYSPVTGWQPQQAPLCLLRGECSTVF